VHRYLRWAIAALALFALSAIACGGGGSRVTTAGLISGDAAGGLYLALGDSIAAGQGASDAATTSYVGLIAAELRERFGDELQVESLAEGGDTTQDLIDKQLAAAVERLREGNVLLVTLTISGNDLNHVQDSPDAAACIADPARPPCPVPDILVGTEERLDSILEQLRQAGPDTTIAIQVYPNLFSGTGHMFERPAEIAFGLLNDVITRAAERHDVLIADPRADFAGRGDELSHLLDPTPDPHPNDAGHRVVAEAFLKVLGLRESSTDMETD
jgi:lysophospholipase L1-like esterase